MASNEGGRQSAKFSCVPFVDVYNLNCLFDMNPQDRFTRYDA